MPVPQYTYTDNTPQLSNKISSTQSKIQSNFQAINELFNVNHVDFNDVNEDGTLRNAGKHKFLTLPFQGSVPVTSSSQMSIYSAATADGNGSEVFFTYPTATSGTPLTGLGQPGLPATPGYGYLAGSVLMKWGTATGITTGANAILFPVSGSIPVFTSVFIVQYTPAVNYSLPAPGSQGPYITSVTTTGFTFNAPTTISTSILWYAIGL